MAVSWKVFCICHRAKLTRMREKGGSEPVFRIPLLHYGVPRFRISSKNTPLHYRVPFLHCPNPFHGFPNLDLRLNIFASGQTVRELRFANLFCFVFPAVQMN